MYVVNMLPKVIRNAKVQQELPIKDIDFKGHNISDKADLLRRLKLEIII